MILWYSNNSILQTSFKLLKEIPSWQLKAGPVRISYLNEDGLDAGGLAKDWFVEMSKSLLNIGAISNQDQNNTSTDTATASFSFIYETQQGVTINPTAGMVYSDDECR